LDYEIRLFFRDGRGGEGRLKKKKKKKEERRKNNKEEEEEERRIKKKKKKKKKKKREVICTTIFFCHKPHIQTFILCTLFFVLQHVYLQTKFVDIYTPPPPPPPFLCESLSFIVSSSIVFAFQRRIPSLNLPIGPFGTKPSFSHTKTTIYTCL
jgi:hypothetical protein